MTHEWMEADEFMTHARRTAVTNLEVELVNRLSEAMAHITELEAELNGHDPRGESQEASQRVA